MAHLERRQHAFEDRLFRSGEDRLADPGIRKTLEHAGGLPVELDTGFGQEAIMEFARHRVPVFTLQPKADGLIKMPDREAEEVAVPSKIQRRQATRV